MNDEKITLFHFTDEDCYKSIVEDGAILPISINDLCIREIDDVRKGGDFAAPCICRDRSHANSPRVVWLASEPYHIFRAPRGHVRITVELDRSDVDIWARWALDHGASHTWVKSKVNDWVDPEWVSEKAIPIDRFVRVDDMRMDQAFRQLSQNIRSDAYLRTNAMRPTVKLLRPEWMSPAGPESAAEVVGSGARRNKVWLHPQRPTLARQAIDPEVLGFTDRA